MNLVYVVHPTCPAQVTGGLDPIPAFCLQHWARGGIHQTDPCEQFRVCSSHKSSGLEPKTNKTNPAPLRSWGYKSRIRGNTVPGKGHTTEEAFYYINTQNSRTQELDHRRSPNLVFFLSNTDKEGFHNKQKHLERFWIGLIRFVFCLLFRSHDQSDASPICVSSVEEEEQFGERCLLISYGCCASGTVIKTTELLIMKCVDQERNKTVDLCFVIRSAGSDCTHVFFPLFSCFATLKREVSISMHTQSSLLSLSGRRNIKGMWMAWPRSSESESKRLFWSYLIFMNNFLDISFAPWSRPLLQRYTMMS